MKPCCKSVLQRQNTLIVGEHKKTGCLSGLLDLVFRFYPEVWIRVTEGLSQALIERLSAKNWCRSMNSSAGSRFTANRRAFPVEGPLFIARLRGQLEAAAKRADDNFPANEYLRIESGEPVLKRLQRNPEPERLPRLEQQIVERMTLLEHRRRLTASLGRNVIAQPLRQHGRRSAVNRQA